MNNIIINNSGENIDIFMSAINNLSQLDINNNYIYSVGINSNINIPISFNNSEKYIYMSIIKKNNKDSWIIINDKIIDYYFNNFKIEVSGDKNFGYKFIINKDNGKNNFKSILLILLIIFFIIMIISIIFYFIL